jgi:ssDNA-binding Zn-finger/Zn-ribbon topoisomerase 1
MDNIVLYVILAGLFIWFIKVSNNKSKWGINLKRVICPVCQTKQPIIRMPKTGKQALWGGTTCPKCQTNLDKYGNIIG